MIPRLIKEETNLGEDNITFIRDIGQWLVYKLPEEEWSKRAKPYSTQVQQRHRPQVAS